MADWKTRMALLDSFVRRFHGAFGAGSRNQRETYNYIPLTDTDRSSQLHTTSSSSLYASLDMATERGVDIAQAEETLDEKPYPFARGVAVGCGPSSPPTYCPGQLVSGGQIAERSRSRDSS